MNGRIRLLTHAARLIEQAMPYLPAGTVNDLVEHPHRCAPDAVTYARITKLPLPVVHGLWGQYEKERAA